jgi:hypothetical protein
MPPTVSAEPHRWGAALAATAAGLVALGITVALHWDLVHDMGGSHPATAFHAGHVWAFEHAAQLVLGGHARTLHTPLMGWPEGVEARLIAWTPALLLYLPLRALLAPLAAFNLTLLLGPTCTAVAGTFAFRGITKAPPWVAAAGALALALSPFFLGTLASGQIAKVHAWVMLLHLWALWRGRGLGGLAAVAGTTMLASFTSPSLTLLLPLSVGVVLVLALSRRVEEAPSIRNALENTALTALALVPAWLYYRGVSGEGAAQGFAPAGVGAEGAVTRAGEPENTAALVETLVGMAWENPGAEMPVHITYLSLPLVIVLGVGVWRRRPASLLGLGLAVVGLVVAAGPSLTVGGVTIPLPAALLDALGYPLATSGMWYRAVALSAMGLCLGMVTTLAPLKNGAIWASLLAFIVVGDGVRSSISLWPRRTTEVYEELALAQELATNPTPGAVLDLPLKQSSTEAANALLRAAVHGRPTQVVARAGRAEDTPHLAALDAQLQPMLRRKDPAGSRALLHELGVFAVTAPVTGIQGMPTKVLFQALGEPRVAGELYVWTFPDE